MSAGQGTLLYDPDCGFCTRAAGWLRGFGTTSAVDPLAPSSADLGVDLDRATREVPFVHDDGRVVYGAAAIAAALVRCRQPWATAGRVLGWAPTQVLARPVYRWVAAHRHRLPGGTASCDLNLRQ